MSFFRNVNKVLSKLRFSWRFSQKELPASSQPSSEEMRLESGLELKEYLVAATLIALFILMAAVSYIKPYPSLSQSELHSKVEKREVKPVKQVQVMVAGVVRHPGSYWVDKGSTLGELLDRVKPHEHADLRRFNREQVIRQPKKWQIQALPMIAVFVSGAVQREGVYQVRKGTRLCDFVQQLDLDLVAETKSLQKKRKLKEGEEIFIPGVFEK